MKIVITDELDGFAMEPMNNFDALSHPGVKVVIKKAKKKLISEGALIEYLSKTFAIRIARGTKIFVNNKQVLKPDGFDSREYPLFQLGDGTWIKGNLKVPVEKPEPLNNIDIAVKNVFVDSKLFDFKVQGWLNYNKLLLISSRDAIHEDGLEYENFIKGLIKHLEENYERKSQGKNQNVKSEKQLTKLFASIVGSIRHIYPAFVEAERARGRVYAQNPVNRARMLQQHKLYRLAHHQQDVDYHRNKSAQVRSIWSGGVNGRFSWRQAEDIALQILSLEGFEEVTLLKQFKGNFYFDIKAVRKHDSKICVFQVTTRTHTEIKRRLSYAKTFDLDFYILYVRPDLTGYILKYTESPGSQGLCFTDMQKIKAIEKDMQSPVI